ncbi:MAG: hypothetical protein WCA81_06320 [Rhizomicrobium sp.]
MKTKKAGKAKIHDLRDLAPVRLAVPDVSGELVGVMPLPATDGENIVSPGVGNLPPGQATHE